MGHRNCFAFGRAWEEAATTIKGDKKRTAEILEV